MKVAEQTWKKKKRPKKKKEKRGTRIGIVKQSEGGGVWFDGSSHDMEPAMPRWMEGGEGEDGGAVARRRGSRRRVERAKSETRCKGEQQKSRGPKAKAKAKAKAKRRATRGLEWSEKLGGGRSSTRGLPTAEADAEADPGASGGLQTADADGRCRSSTQTLQRCENAQRRSASHVARPRAPPPTSGCSPRAELFYSPVLAGCVSQAPDGRWHTADA